MADESLWETRLIRAVTDLGADLADLVQKELRLARGEIVQKLTLGLQAGAWFAIAAVLGADRQADGMVLRTARETIHARTVVNAAGLYADGVEALIARPAINLRAAGLHTIRAGPKSRADAAVRATERIPVGIFAMLVAMAFSTIIAFTPASAAATVTSTFSADCVQTETTSGTPAWRISRRSSAELR